MPLFQEVVLGTFRDVTNEETIIIRDIANGDYIRVPGNYPMSVWSVETRAKLGLYWIDLPLTPAGKAYAGGYCERVNGVLIFTPIWEDAPQ